ncbi:MAG: hypothetical protein RLY93_18260 [Sumerlaeia bacterium]
MFAFDAETGEVSDFAWFGEDGRLARDFGREPMAVYRLRDGAGR